MIQFGRAMIEQIIIIALIVLFVQATTWEGMIFESVGNELERALPDWLYMPLIGCPICMTPWHGTIWFILIATADVGPFSWTGDFVRDFIQVIATVFGAAGVNCFSVMVMKWHEKNKLEVEDLESKDDEIRQLKSEIYAIEEGSDSWKSDAENLHFVLKELVNLKRHKDTFGKDSFYEQLQPELWDKARKIVDEHKNLNPEIDAEN